MVKDINCQNSKDINVKNQNMAWGYKCRENLVDVIPL
jgi:hypothetical protein